MAFLLSVAYVLHARRVWFWTPLNYVGCVAISSRQERCLHVAPSLLKKKTDETLRILFHNPIDTP